jgi:hypothetical protein
MLLYQYTSPADRVFKTILIINPDWTAAMHKHEL